MAPGALELLLVATIERERRHQVRPGAVARQRPAHLELALGRLVERPPSIAGRERVARAVVDLERHELGVAREEGPERALARRRVATAAASRSAESPDIASAWCFMSSLTTRT